MSGNLHPPDLRHLTSVYLALLIIGGQIGLPIIVLTALVCKKVTWHPTLINFCITWIIYSVIYCLYLYSGANQYNPYRNVCMVQASMIHGASPMAVVAGLALVVQTWMTVQHLQCNVLDKIPRALHLFLVYSIRISGPFLIFISPQMVAPPYVVFVGFSVGAGIFAILQPQSVYPSNGLYCTIYVKHFDVVVPSFCAVIMTVILGLEIAISIQYYRQWRNIKKSFPLIARRPSTALCFRIGLICLYSCVGLSCAILFLSDHRTEVTYMLPAALPLTSLLVFGLHKDIICSWTTGLRHQKRSATSLVLPVPSARPIERSMSPLTTIELSAAVS
ncbi:hypothetical protein BS17DRAFT_751217 [Gyrodon lividus]|nr:hypothetical protein BS17DRAFT_751217 [Gyrodon lividus]